MIKMPFSDEPIRMKIDPAKVVYQGGGGSAPTIGENGNWYIDGVDTGKPSRGEQGPAGPQGETGPQGEPGEDYTLTEADKTDIAEEAAAALAGTSVPTPATAAVGQIVKVKAVDADGKITQTEAVDMPSGEEEWEKIADVALTADTSTYDLASFGVYRKVKALMTREKYVSGLNKNVWFRIIPASSSSVNQTIASSFMTIQYGYIAWEVNAEFGSSFAREWRVATNNLQSVQALEGSAAVPTGDKVPSEYVLRMIFADTSVIQDGDTVAVYGVKR